MGSDVFPRFFNESELRVSTIAVFIMLYYWNRLRPRSTPRNVYDLLSTAEPCAVTRLLDQADDRGNLFDNITEVAW